MTSRRSRYIILLLIISSAFLIRPIRSVVLFSDGFESGDFTAWTATGNTPTIVGAPTCEGSFAAQINTGGSEYFIKQVDNNDELYYRFYFQTTVIPDTNGETLNLGSINRYAAHSLVQVSMYHDGADVVWRVDYRRSNAGGTYTIYSALQKNPLINTWYCVDLYYHNGAGGLGDVRVWIDGSELSDLSDSGIIYEYTVNEGRCSTYTTTTPTATVTYDSCIIDTVYIGPIPEDEGNWQGKVSGVIHTSISKVMGINLINIQSIADVEVTPSPPGGDDEWMDPNYVVAESGYWVDIQNAIDEVVSIYGGNGTVYIPPGVHDIVNIDESWGTLYGDYYIGPLIEMPCGVNLKGYPTTRDPDTGLVTSFTTTLRIPWDVVSTYHYDGKYLIQVNGGDVSNFTDISDIMFIGYRSINTSSTYMVGAIMIDGDCEVRVHHCDFEHMANFAVGFSGEYAHGLIDHCRMYNPVGVVYSPLADCTVKYGVSIGRGTGDLWDSDISNVAGQYTNYTIYIENCYFSNWRHCIAGNYGAHYVLRYSDIIDDWGFGSVDSHATAAATGVPPAEVYTTVGTRCAEVYNCTISNATNYIYGTYTRGGSLIATENTVGGGTYDYFIYLLNDPDYPAIKCMVNDTYIWNNTMTDGCGLYVEYDPDGEITQNVNYFLRAPTIGDDGWEWTPYTYPHPLQ